jgi:hypothetical protein
VNNLQPTILSALAFHRWFTTQAAMPVKRRDEPPVLTFMRRFDREPIRAEKSLRDIVGQSKARFIASCHSDEL